LLCEYACVMSDAHWLACLLENLDVVWNN